MVREKITLKTTNENGMTTTLKLDQHKTTVDFGFKPEDVDYIGKIDIKDLEKLEKEEE